MAGQVTAVPGFILIAMASADPADCVCCGGGIEGEWPDLCHECAVSIVNRTRGVGHPHAPSPAQQEIIDRDGPIGGTIVAEDPE